MKTIFRVLLALMLGPLALRADDPPTVTLLNVSYDVSRDLYHGLNPLFVKQWKSDTNQEAVVTMSHGASTAQAQKVLQGLDADVVTMDQETDIDTLAAAQFVAKDWKDKYPYFSVPYSSTILFMVRGGNPKGIKDWDDLVKPGVRIIMPNPKTSGNGRYSYLAAYGYALKQFGGDDKQAREFVGRLFKNVEILDVGGRAATTTFAQRGLGDVLLTFENEVMLIEKDPVFGGEKLQTVVPSLSVRADAPVAMVDKYVDEHHTRPVAEAYLRFLFSPAGQEEIARNGFRPSDKDVLAKHAAEFPAVEMIDVDATFGGWAKAQKTHFADGGTFDQVCQP